MNSEAIMTNQVRAPLNSKRRLLALAVAAAATSMVVGALNAPRLGAQSPTAHNAEPSFEVATTI